MRGVLLGLAVGNLLGLDVEGASRQAIAERYPGGVTYIDPRERTRSMDDDLAQAVELGESLVKGGDYMGDFANRLVRWDWENGRGIGSTTAAAIDLLRRGHPPLEAGRMVYDLRDRIAPNGGLMRCAPVALACHRNPDSLAQVSAETCVVTHYAPTCQWSCIIINAAIAALLNDWEMTPMALVEAAIRDGADNEVMVRAQAVGDDIGDLKLDNGLIGHTLLCFQAGLWALRTPLNFEDALVSVVNAGGDTDTNGAVAGAVLAHAAGRRPYRNGG